MSARMNWERTKAMQAAAKLGVDPAVDATVNLDKLLEMEWDSTGNRWDNRRFIADHFTDNVENVLEIYRRRKTDEESYIPLKMMLGVLRNKETMRNPRVKRIPESQWTDIYMTSLRELQREWKSIKMEIAFTYANAATEIALKQKFGNLIERSFAKGL